MGYLDHARRVLADRSGRPSPERAAAPGGAEQGQGCDKSDQSDQRSPGALDGECATNADSTAQVSAAEAGRAALRIIPESLLAALQAAGAWLELDGVKAPAGALTPELRDALAPYRNELRALARWRAELLAEDRRRGEDYEAEKERRGRG